MTAPGLIGTLASFFGAGTGDPSVAYRVSDYPLVERFLEQAPWFGRGGVDVPSRQRHKHPRQPVPEDRSRTGIGRGRRLGRLLPGADDRRSRREATEQRP